jgi:hypothetical protein
MNKHQLWPLDRTDRIGGFPAEVVGAPRRVEGPSASALLFDGVSDGLVLACNPILDAAVFTIEAVFRPDAGGAAEQRFFHIQEERSDNRVLLETRLTNDGRWYADTCIHCGTAKQVVNDPDLTHPLGMWHALALTCDGRQMTQYVNGRREGTAPIAFLPQGPGRVSIGMRINRVYWFKGAIRLVRITRACLPEAELLRTG